MNTEYHPVKIDSDAHPKWLVVSKKNENIKIYFELKPLGKDFVLLIHGGVSHAGTVIICNPVHRKNSSETSIINFQDHREELLARPFAEKLCVSLNTRVVCICGVHIKNASKQDIAEVLNIAKNADSIIEEITINEKFTKVDLS